MIRPLIVEHTDIVPAIVEIPSKDEPYDEKKDPIMKRINTLLGTQQTDT